MTAVESSQKTRLLNVVLHCEVHANPIMHTISSPTNLRKTSSDIRLIFLAV